MNRHEYIKTRLDDQINWYDRKSVENQRSFKRMRVAEIVVAALIPFVSGIITAVPTLSLPLSIVTGLLGVIVAILAGVIAVGRHQELWVEFRTTCESLKKEKVIFSAGVPPYDGEDAFTLLVQRVETLISKENTKWADTALKQKTAESSNDESPQGSESIV